MTKSAVISFRADEELIATLDRLAAAHDRSRAWLVNELLRREVARETELLDGIERGIADLDAGRSITHEQLVEMIEARRLGRQAA